VQGVGGDLRRFARRQPGLFLAAAGVAGFVMTRMLRNAQGDNGITHQQTSAPSLSTQPPAPVPMGVGAPLGEPALPETIG
jgi:hypothetical protein